MTGVDKNPLAMNYVSVSSWYGNTATYKLDFTTANAGLGKHVEVFVHAIFTLLW